MKILALVISCLTTLLVAAKPLPLIPEPAKVSLEEGTFPVTFKTVVLASPKLKAEADILMKGLAGCTGSEHRIFFQKFPIEKSISVEIDPSLPAEHYKVQITPEKVSVTGHDHPAVVHGIQTLIQLLPPFHAKTKKFLPCLTITDHARTETRALKLDLASHLFPVQTLTEVIDLLSFLKFNTLILSFNSPEGWRLELKGYPKLISIGATRAVTSFDGDQNSENYSGHYTQQAIGELITHANSRHIKLIPAFAIPGNADAILASYPEMGEGPAPSVQTTWKPSSQRLVANQATLKFIDALTSQVSKLFPSKLILLEHSSAQDSALQKHLQGSLQKNKLSAYQSKGLTDIELAPWQFPEGLIKSYRAAPGLLTVQDVHKIKLPESSPGVLVSLNTQHVATPKELFIALFPRLVAASEVAWHHSSSYDNFIERWENLYHYFLRRKIQFLPSYKHPTRNSLHGTIVTSTMSHDGNHWPELSFDGRIETYFRSSGGIKKEEHITYQFPISLTGKAKIASGLINGEELLEASFSASSDGETWENLTEFFDGLAEAHLPENTRFIRIQATKDQETPIILSELLLNEALLVADFQETRHILLNPQTSVDASFSCDFSQYPSLREKIHHLRNDYFKFYPLVGEFIGTSSLPEATHEMRLTLDPKSDHPALNPLVLDKLSLENARAAFLDHLTRTLSGFSGSDSLWFKNALCGYMCLTHLDQTSPLEETDPKQTGAFLKWLEKNHGDRCIKYACLAFRQGSYGDKVWTISASKSLEDLLSDYQK